MVPQPPQPFHRAELLFTVQTPPPLATHRVRMALTQQHLIAPKPARMFIERDRTSSASPSPTHAITSNDDSDDDVVSPDCAPTLSRPSSANSPTPGSAMAMRSSSSSSVHSIVALHHIARSSSGAALSSGNDETRALSPSPAPAPAHQAAAAARSFAVLETAEKVNSQESRWYLAADTEFEREMVCALGCLGNWSDEVVCICSGCNGSSVSAQCLR